MIVGLVFIRGYLLVGVLVSSVFEAPGGTTMKVLFSTFFSSLAGGLIMVVFFSVTFSAGAVSIRASHPERKIAAAARTKEGFICLEWYVGSYFSVVVVVLFCSINGAGSGTDCFTTTLEAMKPFPSLM